MCMSRMQVSRAPKRMQAVSSTLQDAVLICSLLLVPCQLSVSFVRVLADSVRQPAGFLQCMHAAGLL